jgi:hypothetical protein
MLHHSHALDGRLGTMVPETALKDLSGRPGHGYILSGRISMAPQGHSLAAVTTPSPPRP